MTSKGLILNNNENINLKYKLLFEQSSIAMVLLDFESGQILEVNEALSKMLDYTKDELLNLKIRHIIAKEYEQSTNQSNEQLLKTNKFDYIEQEYIKKDKTRIDVKVNGFLLSNKVWIQIQEITSIKKDTIIDTDNKNLLEYIAIENDLSKVFKKIVNLAELRNPETMCSILLLNETKTNLLEACAPSLPDFYNEAIHGVAIGEKIGSCGSAVYKKKRVIVENIDTHENWQDFLELTQKANLHSCWSEPIISSKNEILGSFAIYSNKAKAPTDFEIKLIESYSNLASKAIEKNEYTQELLKREHELEELFHNTMSGLMYISGERILIKANQMLSTIFEYENPEEMIGISMSELHLSEKNFQEFGEMNFDSLKEQDKLHIEYQLKKKDGSPIWCELSGKALDKNKPADLSKGVLWTINDITLRKQYKEELKNSEILNRNIISTIPDLVWLKDEEGNYISCNSEFEKCFGIKEKDIIDKNDYDFVDKDEADSFRIHDKIAMNAKETVVNEEWVTYETGKKKILIETSKKAMRDEDGNIIGVLGLGHDITKRKERETELKNLNIKADELTRSQQVLLSLFDKGDSVLFNWKNDDNWTVEYISKSVTKLFGYTQDDFKSGKITYSSCIHRDDLKSVIDEVLHSEEKNLDYFKHFGYEILMAASRKSMIDKISPAKTEDRLPGTLAIHLESIRNGASIIRCHDVKEHIQAIKVQESILNI